MKNLTLAFITIFSFSITAQDYAVNQLENSPRHHEWVEVKYGDRVVHCFVAYPENSEKALTVIVIHENRGLNDWARSFTDQIAEAGYIAIAPDLLSGASDKYEKTKDYPTSDEARSAIYQLDPEQVKNDLNAVQDYAENLKAANGKTVSIGFCWGGSQSFRFATYNNDLEAAFVFYGSAPESQSEIDNIEIPVYGFYGGNDNRINSGIPETEKMMEKAGNTFEYEIYEGAGHAYMRRGDDPNGDGPNVEARNQSWERIKKLLKEL